MNKRCTLTCGFVFIKSIVVLRPLKHREGALALVGRGVKMLLQVKNASPETRNLIPIIPEVVIWPKSWF